MLPAGWESRRETGQSLVRLTTMRHGVEQVLFVHAVRAVTRDTHYDVNNLLRNLFRNHGNCGKSTFGM